MGDFHLKLALVSERTFALKLTEFKTLEDEEEMNELNLSLGDISIIILFSS